MTWPRVKVAGSFSRRFSGNRVLTIHSPTPSVWYMRSEKSSAWLQNARRGCPCGGGSLAVRAHSATCHSHTCCGQQPPGMANSPPQVTHAAMAVRAHLRDERVHG